MAAETREYQSVAEALAAAAQQDADQGPGRFLPTPDVYRAEIAMALSAEQPAWLRAARQRGADALARQGFPTPKHEDWHYTSTAPIAELAFPSLTAASGSAVTPAVTAAELAPYRFGHEDWPTLVFVNGRFDAASSKLDTLPEGVRALPLAQALVEQAELVERVLGTIANPELHPFAALNQALVVDGALLTVAKEMEAEVPVHLVYVTDATGARGTTHPRTLIVAERHSKLTVLESHVAIGEATYLTNHVTEIDVADGATVTHLKLQRESQRAFHVAHVEARQGRDSHFVSFSFATGAQLSRTNVYTLLGGEGCGATLNGLYLLGGEQHCDH